MPVSSPIATARAGAVALLFAAAATFAQSEVPPAPAKDDVIAELEARRVAAESDTALAEDVKGRTLELLTRAISEQRQAAEVRAAMTATEALINEAPARIAALNERLEKPAPTASTEDFAPVSLDELSRRAREKQLELERAREELKARERDLAALTALGATLSDEVAERRALLRQIREDGAAAPPEEPPVAAAARGAYSEARVARIEAEIAQAELQLSNYEPLVRLATLERDAAALTVPRLDLEREALISAVEARRSEQARAARKDAEVTEAAAMGMPAAVAAIAAENASLREELEKVTAQSVAVAEDLRVAERRVSELDADLVSIRERVQTVGATEAIGRLLRRRLVALQDVETDRLRAFRRGNEIVRATDRRIDLGERRRGLANLDVAADAVMAEVAADELAGIDEALVRETLTSLLQAERTTLDDLREVYGRYLTQLTSFDAVERQLATTVGLMREFIRRELLWIRTVPPLSPSDFAAAPSVLSPLLVGDNWSRALGDASSAASSSPELTTLGLLVVLALFALRGRARRRLAALGALTGRIRTDAFRHTLYALVITALMAAAAPAALVYLGWLLRGGDDAADFSLHLSATFTQCANLMIIFSSARWLLQTDGLAQHHFRWPEAVRLRLRRELRWLTVVSLTFVGFAVFGVSQGRPEAVVALGRPALMGVSVALAVFLWRVFRFDGEMMQAARRQRPDSILVRTWRLWFPLLLAIPAANVVATAAGYHDAARTATVLLIDSSWLLLGLWVLRDVMLRWFTLSERRMRFEQALRQREEQRAERERAEEGESGDEPAATEVEVPQVDFRELGAQGRAMVQFGVGIGVVFALWTLWSDLLPALTVLDDITLPFNRVTMVDGVAQQTAVTATDVAVALIVLAATLIGARNLSGVLGFTLLKRVADDAGVQYAIVTLCQYALVAAGLLYAFSTLGVQWSKLQWLVAALGVGLGFGLQEIVANFVSGIILLLERPVRVGDVVTVGDATGTVSRIRIRATTIIDWDRKELVVPNKEFVTGRLLNWTLSNDVTRLIVPVGIAYGEDPRRARTLLLEAAAETEHVLEDPKPIVLFNSFGDNALGLELRVYLAGLDHFLSVQTGLHDLIYEKFERAGIVIAFPQRDVHLDTSNGPLEIRLSPPPESARTPSRPWRPR